MGFTLCPDDGGLPRIWRFVDESLGYTNGGKAIVAMLLDGNVLVIDRELFSSMPELERHMVLRTHAKFTTA